jgi:hypothetical protein
MASAMVVLPAPARPTTAIRRGDAMARIVVATRPLDNFDAYGINASCIKGVEGR